MGYFDYKIKTIKKSCLKCGWEWFGSDPCCSEPYLVSEALKEITQLKEELKKEREIVDLLEELYRNAALSLTPKRLLAKARQRQEERTIKDL